MVSTDSEAKTENELDGAEMSTHNRRQLTDTISYHVSQMRNVQRQAGHSALL